MVPRKTARNRAGPGTTYSARNRNALPDHLSVRRSVPINLLQPSPPMHLLYSPELANLYVIGGGSLGFILLIVLLVLLLR